MSVLLPERRRTDSKVSQSLSSPLELKSAIERVLEKLEQDRGLLRAAVMILDEETRQIYIDVALGLPGDGVRTRYQLGEGIMGRGFPSPHARCRGRVQLSLAPGRRGAHRGVACCAAEGTTLAQTGLATLAGSRWVGAGELWLDPLGDEAREYDCTNDQRRIGALYLVARRHAARRRLHPSRRTGKLVRQLASAERRRVLRATRSAGIARPPPCLPGTWRPGLALAHDLVREAEWRVGAADDERRAMGRGAARRAHGVHAQVLSIATLSLRRLPPSRILRLRRVPLARPRARAGFRRTKFPSSPLARRIRSGRMPR